ncbi:hypothetical protein PG991_008351 [Apiospora marii]|uniref:Uncharacterized protein n=1 Tax=Apiospora marii TaxID=335849 RepID=A0ABR1RQP9_9PEZI
MAYIPQQPLWVPYNPIYYSFPQYQPTLYQVIKPNTCNCPTCQRLRANGQPDISQHVDGRGRPHNLPENRLRDGPPGLGRTGPATRPGHGPARNGPVYTPPVTRPGYGPGPSRSREAGPQPLPELDDSRRRRRMQSFTDILREEAALDEREAVLRDIRRSRHRRRMQSMFDDMRASSADGTDDVIFEVVPGFFRQGGGDGHKYCEKEKEEEDGKQCRWCASASTSADSGSGSASSSSCDYAPALDPWMEKHKWGKGKDKEALQKEREEHLVWPALFKEKGPENKGKESVTGSNPGSDSSRDSAGPADPWGPKGWGSDKGKEKEGSQQEPEEGLVMPTNLFSEKASGASKSESGSSSSEALSGSASREF